MNGIKVFSHLPFFASFTLFLCNLNYEIPIFLNETNDFSSVKKAVVSFHIFLHERLKSWVCNIYRTKRVITLSHCS